MPALPSASSFTGSGVTEADFKTQLTNLINYLSGLLDTPGTAISALQKLGALGNAVLTKSAAYTVVATDRGKLIDCSGTWTLSLTAAATLGSFAFAVRNSGSGTITIDPDLSEQIDGATTLSLAAGESCVVLCDGTKFYSVGKSSSGAADVQTFNASGTWTKPAKGSMALIQAIGGGGSGGRSGGGGGAGGRYAERLVPLSLLGATESVVVGAGGAAVSADGAGNAGGDSSFGAWLTAKGGGRGGGKTTSPTEGGGASGALSGSAGADSNYAGAGGGSGFSSGPGGRGIGNGSAGRAPDGGAGGSDENGGGGGGGGNGTSGANGNGGAGGKGVYGAGAGGGCAANAGVGGPGGSSVYAGNGGAGGVTNGTAGTAPGGGGGGCNSGTSGAGAAGRVTITVW